MGFATNIVVALDFNTSSQAARLRAEQLGRALGATLHLVHGIGGAASAVAPETAALPSIWRAARQRAHHELEKIRGEIEAQGVSVKTRVSDRDPVHAILGAAESCRADLIMMGTHGHSGVRHVVLGSVAEGVLRSAACPVFAAKEDPQAISGPIRRIAVASDLHDRSEGAVRFAGEWARDTGAVLDLVHVFSFRARAFPHTEAWSREIAEGEAAARAALGAQRDRILDAALPVDLTLLRGDAPDLLLERHAEQTGAELIVTGTRHHKGFLQPSVARELLHRSKRCVAVLRE